MSTNSTTTSKLFQPITVGDIRLSHRVVFAPATRYRADDSQVPLVPIVSEYYGQRASEPGTLLITESTHIHPRASGTANAPGIWSDAQIEAWRQIVDVVHAKGSYIFLQICAVGRAAEPTLLQAQGLPYVGITDAPLSSRPEQDPHPRALTVQEIQEYVQYFADAASNAVHKAGFDGVEIHGAHGFLIEQSLKEIPNNRTDEYGGSVENRSRFTLEILDAVVKAVGPRKTAIRFSPWANFQDTLENDPRPLYSYLVNEIKKAHPSLAYLHTVDPRLGMAASEGFVGELSNQFIRDIWTGGEGHDRVLISAGGFTLETATELADTKGDLVAFGKYFIANPDLPYKLRENVALTAHNRATFYTTPGTLDPRGYTDYPFAPRESQSVQIVA